MKHSTAMIIEALRADGEPKLLLLAADRLEELHQKCNMHYETICDLTKERDEARAEMERLKTELSESIRERNKTVADLINQRDEALKNQQPTTVAQQLTTRPEPSRLEIAALAMQGFITSSGFVIDIPKNALEYADKLIAAAKEGK